MPRSSTLALRALTPALAVFAGGCQAWRRVPVGQPGPGYPGEPRVVRATLADGRTVTLAGARVERDSLVGTLVPSDASGAWSRTAVALRGVRRMEQRRSNLARVGDGLVVGAVLAGVAVLGLLLYVTRYGA